MMKEMFNDRFEVALQSPNPHERLAGLASELFAEGNNSDEVFQIFDAFRAQLRLANRESDEDEVMDVMDRICGWCSSQVKLFPVG